MKGIVKLGPIGLTVVIGACFSYQLPIAIDAKLSKTGLSPASEKRPAMMPSLLKQSSVAHAESLLVNASVEGDLASRSTTGDTAQYTFQSLHPVSAEFSECTSLSYGGRSFAGSLYYTDGLQRATLWLQDGQVIDLHPSGWTRSCALAISSNGIYQTGWGEQNSSNNFHALRWAGSKLSMKNLHPGGALASNCSGISADGMVAVGDVDGHAFMWGERPSPWHRDIHPTELPDRGTAATAISADGQTQVGYLSSGGVGGGIAAVRWSGTASSFITELSGPWANYLFTGVSSGGKLAVGTYNTEAPRYPFLYDLVNHQWQFLPNLGWGLTYCRSISPNGKFKAGYGSEWFYAPDNAIVWEGQSNTPTNLGDFLPDRYTSSRAYAVDDQGNVCGTAYNDEQHRWEAAVWRRDAISFTFDPDRITVSQTSIARVNTSGNVVSVSIQADPNQGVPTVPIKLKSSGNIWTAKVLASTLAKRICNPVRFTAKALTADGIKTACASLAIVEAGGSLVGLYNDAGQAVRGIVCDNPSSFNDLATTDSVTLDQADKLELRLPAGMVALSDQASVCLSGSTSSDTHGNPNAGEIVVRDNKVWYLPPDEFNYEQKPSSISEVRRTPLRNVTVKVTTKLTDGRIVAFNPLSVTLARPVAVLIHGINSGIDVWEDLIFGINGANLDGPAMPYALLDHSAVEEGNGPVEYGAMKLQELSTNIVWRVNSGQFATQYKKYSGGNQTYTFDYYKNRPLSCKRVDIIAHSYGGVIARWYIASNGSRSSLDWYKRAGTNTSMVTTPASYSERQNVRKLITLGSMWRGVPICNYLNEVHFPVYKVINGESRAFRNAEVNNYPFDLGVLIESGDAAAWFKHGLGGTEQSAIEVMAVESPWLSKLIYGDQNSVYRGLPKPFIDDIGYGAIVGDREKYPRVVVNELDEGLYGAIDLVQTPTWFPYLSKEWRRVSDVEEPGYSDGVVPVWSAVIPESVAFVTSNHGQIPANHMTYVRTTMWLNSSVLPLGSKLNVTWQNLDSFTDPLSGMKWSFTSGYMAPSDRSVAYVQDSGIGRLGLSTWGQ